jgi:hypothetical protein
VWLYSSPVDQDEIDQALQYIEDWLNLEEITKSGEIVPELARSIADIREIPSPFDTQAPGFLKAASEQLQVSLEGELLDLFQALSHELSPGAQTQADVIKSRLTLIAGVKRQLGI